MNQAQFIFHEVNFSATVLVFSYLVFFITFSTVTTFMTLSVYKNVDKFRTANKINRRAFFTLYLLLNLSNIPFGIFVTGSFKKLGEYSDRYTGPIYNEYPLYELASAMVTMGMASHIVFVAFWILAWMHVESGIKNGD
jgi:hypothetical protein